MFKKENRLVPGTRFNNSYSFTCPQFVLKERKNGLKINRFGIVVAKKIDKRAVRRNAIKRLFRTKLMDMNKTMSVGHDILFIVKKGITEKAKEDNLLTIEEAVRKAGLIKDQK